MSLQHLVDHAPGVDERVGLSEVLAALSYALDLTEGQPAGHTIRSCLVGMRLGDAIGLPDDARAALYYALLLKDAGCSSNAARMAAVFGADDRVVKPRMKLVDWHHRFRLALRTAATAGVGGPFGGRIRHFLRIASAGEFTRELIRIRCDRGADIARRLGFPGDTCEAIRSLDEHWCGLGYPAGRAAEEIPLLARILNVAQTVEAFHDARGIDGVVDVLRARRGTWFDPRLADVVMAWRTDVDWWASLRSAGAERDVLAAEPSDEPRTVDAESLDEIARAFAEIIDAKSPYTFEHSTRVAGHATGIAAAMGVDAPGHRRILRAGLLHDIGKLGVSNRILDKAGALTPAEFAAMARHPVHTYEILSHVRAFSPFARMAALHHEKLDGSGYPWRLRGPELDRDARILAVADIYDALTSDRPYRAAMTRDAALALIERDRGAKLCGEAIDALAVATAVTGVAS